MAGARLIGFFVMANPRLGESARRRNRLDRAELGSPPARAIDTARRRIAGALA